ncbi:MAG: hypothetical protein ACOCZ6_01405 [Nanoarchaeota archaeon]
MNRLWFIFILLFSAGWLSSSVYSETVFGINLDNPDGDLPNTEEKLPEVASPMDRIPEDQINVHDDRVVIKLNNPEWSSFTDTNSMDPVLDKGANGIHIIPEKPSDINVGDIVAYESEYSEGTIIHRVVKVGSDEEGAYYKLKGDNSAKEDPGKIRFKQIKRVLVAVVY